LLRTSTRPRLHAAGWWVGNARSFLGLADSEAAQVEMKLALGECQQERRQARHVSQVQLAQRLGSSQSRVAKMEAHDRMMSGQARFRVARTIGRQPVGRRRSARQALVRNPPMKYAMRQISRISPTAPPP
jgi:hypothetical protein